MDLELDIINGYFWLISSARSGHNFIKNNIESWTGSGKIYVNLEQESPQNFSENYIELSSEIYSKSFKAVCVRDLLNWYISVVFLGKKYERPFIKNLHIPKIENLRWEREINNELLRNPDITFIPNNLSKERFLEKTYPIGGQYGQTLSAKERSIKAIKNWAEIAKEFLGMTDYMKGSVSVYYDEFFVSGEYRKNICDKLGGIYNEKMLNHIPQIGDYSTFDGNEFQERAQEMKVLERYKIWDTSDQNRELLALLKDSEALELYLNNFEVNDDKRRFIEKWIK